MKRMSNFLFLLSVLWSTLGPVAIGGNEAGGGDIKDPTEGAAWFLGDRSIRTCWEVSANFGIATFEVSMTIENVMNAWRAYLVQKKIWTEEHFVKQGAYIGLNFQRMANCDGTEDLKLYFGTMNSEIAKEKAQYHNPIAFVHRVSYDLRTGWGKGFIWFALPEAIEKGFPDWTKPFRLHGMLLHEIGHVLGCGHVPDTIMDSSIGYIVEGAGAPESRVQAQLTSIDDLNELSPCLSCAPARYEGTISESDDAGEKNTFQTFTGRSPVGSIRAQLLLGLQTNHRGFSSTGLRKRQYQR